MFIPFGSIILCFDFIADMYYFWMCNLRPEESLRQIIIPKEQSIVSHHSIRELGTLQTKYTVNKIKTVATST